MSLYDEEDGLCLWYFMEACQRVAKRLVTMTKIRVLRLTALESRMPRRKWVVLPVKAVAAKLACLAVARWISEQIDQLTDRRTNGWPSGALVAATRGPKSSDREKHKTFTNPTKWKAGNRPWENFFFLHSCEDRKERGSRHMLMESAEPQKKAKDWSASLGAVRGSRPSFPSPHQEGWMKCVSWRLRGDRAPQPASFDTSLVLMEGEKQAKESKDLLTTLPASPPMLLGPGWRKYRLPT